jgi:hypothetical protein
LFSKQWPAAGNVNLPVQTFVECLITSLIHKHTAAAAAADDNTNTTTTTTNNNNNNNKCSTVPPTMFFPWIPLKQSKIA